MIVDDRQPTECSVAIVPFSDSRSAKKGIRGRPKVDLYLYNIAFMVKRSERKIKSADRTIDVIEALHGRRQLMSLSDLAEETGLSVSTIHTYLSTLEDRDIVRKEEKQYKLGPKLIMIGEYVKHTLDLYQAGRSEINRLAEETNESVHLIVENNAKMLVLHEWYGKNAAGVDQHERKREGYLDHFHATACGKALLAYLPKERVREIIDQGELKQLTVNTITDPDELLDELDEIYKKGYAISDEEQIQGLRAIGAPIRNNEGYPVGSLSVSAPTRRLEQERLEGELPRLVMNTANKIEIEYRNFD
jgi:DNA-binding IclR family transcriptional regulator